MRTLAAAVLLILSLDIAAQTRRMSQLVLRCVNASRLSVAGETIIYKDCDDGKTYLSKDGAAFAEVTTAAASVQPKNGAKAYQSGGGTQVVTSATWTPLTFDSESWDFGGYHSTASNTSRFTVPSGKAGLHIFECGIEATTTAGSLTWLRVTKNGTPYLKVGNLPKEAFPAGGIVAIDNLDVGDYLEVEAYGESASVTTLPTRTYCSMALIGQ